MGVGRVIALSSMPRESCKAVKWKYVRTYGLSSALSIGSAQRHDSCGEMIVGVGSCNMGKLQDPSFQARYEQQPREHHSGSAILGICRNACRFRAVHLPHLWRTQCLVLPRQDSHVTGSLEKLATPSSPHCP